MRRISRQTWGIILCALLIFSVTTVFAGRGKPGQAVVKLNNGAKPESIAEEFNLEVADSIPEMQTYLFTFSPNRPVQEVVDQLNANGYVEVASPNTTIDLPEIFQISQGFPDESVPVFNLGVSPQEFYDQESTYDIGIDSAQLFGTGSGIVIAVIDNGIDTLHPLIQNSSVLESHSFMPMGDTATPLSPMYGHGTFVTGLLLLTAPDATILPIKAFNDQGIGDLFYVARAIEWAVNQGADVINMSFGTNEVNQLLLDAVNLAVQNNVVMVAATGNDATTEPYYPAAYPEVIAVASVDTLELLADFSNYGSYVDLVAPGVNIYSASTGEFQWSTWSGTSFSAPVVSGTIALMKGRNPGYSISEIQDHLRNTARTEFSWGAIIPPDEKYGYGMVDCYNAVAQLSIGDFDLDGKRDIADLVIIADHFGYRYMGGNSPTGDNQNGNVFTNKTADLNCDRVVNIHDLIIMIYHVYESEQQFSPCYNFSGSQ